MIVMQRSLATDLQALSMDYRKQQKGYLQKLQRQREGQSVDDGIGIGKQQIRQDEDDGFSQVVLIQCLLTICTAMDNGGSYVAFNVFSLYQCCQFQNACEY
jgi:hypothetical protein